MSTGFSLVVYLGRRWGWLYRQLSRAECHCAMFMGFAEGKRVDEWLREAIRLHGEEGMDERRARRIVQLLLYVSTELEGRLPQLGEVSDELRQALNRN